MKPVDVKFSCTCGQVQGVVHDVAPHKGNRVKCYCISCQTAARVLGYEDTLDPYGGTEVFQTVPSKVEFQTGIENLACLRLSPRGLLRWHSSCCNAPLFTMPDVLRIAVVGLFAARVSPENQEHFGGKVKLFMTKTAVNPPPGFRDRGIFHAVVMVLWRALKAAIRRDGRAPFFNADGTISVTPRVLTLQERKAATPD